MSTAGLVLGIVSLLLGLMAWFPCMGWSSWFIWILPLIGAILGGVGMGADKQAGKPTGMATAGLVLSIVAFLIIGVRAFVSIFTLGI